MKPFNMHWIKIDNLTQAERVLSQVVGLNSDSISYLAGKAVIRAVKLERVPYALAHRLKQEMLSLGGDAAFREKSRVSGSLGTDVVLLGTNKQLKKLASIIDSQPFGLESVAVSLDKLLTCLERSPDRKLCCRGNKLELGHKTLLMGILNITPDSFVDGGRYVSTEKALEQAARLIREGADILDIGGESTRPGYAGISAEEEWARLEPVLQELLPRCPVPVSVDTQKAAVAEKALNYGVHIINDIWGLQRDPAMAGVISASQAAVVIMHNRNNTEYTDLLGEILAFLEQSVEMALKSGIKEDRIVIDPGIGFGKTPEQNLEVLSRLAELKALPYPLLLGVSRKSVIGRTLHLPVEERLEPTIALNTLGIAAGADIIRVHDLAANKKAAMMTDLVIRRKGEKTEGTA